jgi:hypothetical protein
MGCRPTRSCSVFCSPFRKIILTSNFVPSSRTHTQAGFALTRNFTAIYRDWQKTRQPGHGRPLIKPPGRYKKLRGRVGVHSASRTASNIVYRDKTLIRCLSVYIATRNCPAEYFCRRTYKKLALEPLHLIWLRNQDKLFILIKLVPRHLTWPIFYANAGPCK